MKEVISHNITIAVAAITLVLTGIWYYQTKEFEPLIGIVASVGALITGIFFREPSTDDITGFSKSTTNQATIKGNGNVVMQDVKGGSININTGNTTNQKADKIYNIEKIDKADFF